MLTLYTEKQLMRAYKVFIIKILKMFKILLPKSLDQDDMSIFMQPI